MDADTIIYGLVTLLLGGACTWLWKTVLDLKQRVSVNEALDKQTKEETDRRFSESKSEVSTLRKDQMHAQKDLTEALKELTRKVDKTHEDMAVVKATCARLDRSTRGQ